jgi:DNA-binding transcriptional regulator of glucitol operon
MDWPLILLAVILLATFAGSWFAVSRYDENSGTVRTLAVSSLSALGLTYGIGLMLYG